MSALSPQCIGIIMDGNRRWARTRGASPAQGHRRGYEKLKEMLRWVKEAGIGHLIVYAFSTENWTRSRKEVSYLMRLFRLVLTKELAGIKKEGGRILCIGQRERFPRAMQKFMALAEQETAGGRGPTLALALSYGGRAEILAAANAALTKSGRALTEDAFRAHLWTRDIPDPDLIIRTGGAMRLSGFLPWQGVYSELFFTETLWPEFSKKEFDGILREFARRVRNFGK